MTYYVYVIELDKEVLNIRRFRKRNPHATNESRCFYVGQSRYEPDVRFEQHKNGHKANRYVREYGMYLRRRKYKKYNPIATREQALKTEEMLANKLVREGHAVWWG